MSQMGCQRGCLSARAFAVGGKLAQRPRPHWRTCGRTCRTCGQASLCRDAACRRRRPTTSGCWVQPPAPQVRSQPLSAPQDPP